MNRQPYRTPPRWWAPTLRPWWVRFMRPWRRRLLRRKQRLVRIDVEGVEHLQQAVRGNGVLITPNHSAHYDSFCLYEAADRVKKPFYIMTAWQVFAMSSRWERWNMTCHGCFSIDRESTDLKAYKQAVEILQETSNPLVIFPEGDIYHINDRVTPFREGAAAIALSAAKKADRPIVAVPCAIKFWYVEDPTPELVRLMDRLEQRFLWTPRPEKPLPDRIYRLAEGMLILKELEYLGQASSGPVPSRIDHLSDVILRRVEEHLDTATRGGVPERVKELRRQAIQAIERPETEEARRKVLNEDMNDLFLVMQLYSYPGDYVAERPSVERIAETLDKFEEDILDAALPTVRGKRRVTIRFGEPIPVRREGQRNQVGQLTDLLEQRVQRLLDEVNAAGTEGTLNHRTPITRRS